MPFLFWHDCLRIFLLLPNQEREGEREREKERERTEEWWENTLNAVDWLAHNFHKIVIVVDSCSL